VPYLLGRPSNSTLVVTVCDYQSLCLSVTTSLCPIERLVATVCVGVPLGRPSNEGAKRRDVERETDSQKHTDTHRGREPDREPDRQKDRERQRLEITQRVGERPVVAACDYHTVVVTYCLSLSVTTSLCLSERLVVTVFVGVCFDSQTDRQRETETGNYCMWGSAWAGRATRARSGLL